MKFNKYQFVIVMSFIAFILFLFFSQQDSSSSLNEDYINELKNKEGIEILDYKIVNNVKRPFAYIFFEKGNKIGSYYVRNINNKLVYGSEIIVNVDIHNKVQHFGVSSGYPYMMIRINDEKILEDGRVLLFSFGNKMQHRISLNNMKKDYIIVGDLKEAGNQIAYLEILDKNNIIIYRD